MKAKNIFTLTFFLLLLHSASYSQQQNEFRIYYGLVDSKLLTLTNYVGGGSYDNNNSRQVGIRYLRKLSNKFSFETGVDFTGVQVDITPAPTGIPVRQMRTEKLQLVSIPLYSNLTFGKYFFVNGGPTLDFQRTQTSFNSQSGIGLGVGLGGKYNFGNFLLYANPNFKLHTLLPFSNENSSPQKLTEIGVQFGVGYGF